MYKPPAANFEKFKQIFKNYLLQHKNKRLYITGDFNLNLLQHTKDNNTNQFVHTLLQNNLIPVIQNPPRVTLINIETLIDNLFTNDFNNCKINSGIIKTDISDHFPIFFILNNKTTEKDSKTKCEYKTIFKRVINNNSIIEFRDMLSQVDWHLLKECKDADSAYDLFLRFFLTGYHKAFPVIEKKITNKSLEHPWMTKGLLKSSQRRSKGSMKNF